MTLCVAWRSNKSVHFASDSRLTIGTDSHADVAIKILSLPYRIFSPTDPSGARTLDFEGEIGMCFAGSAVSSLFVKESVAEIIKELQYAPGYTNISMDGLAKFIFKAYRLISTEVCRTEIGARGRAAIIIAGWCIIKKQVRTFLLETSDDNAHSCTEILTSASQYLIIGSGKSKAEAALPPMPSDLDYLKALKAVIDDTGEESVGGAIQYGRFVGRDFRISGIVEFAGGVHYWRGGLDLNGADFMDTHDALIPGYKYIDPFDTFSN